MYDLIVDPLTWKHEPNNDKNDQTNLVKAELSSIFPNAQTVHIAAGHRVSQFSFSLLAFLSVLQKTQWKKIMIKARGTEEYANWISVIWPLEGAIIEKAYKANKYSIVHSMEEVDYDFNNGFKDDYLKIQSMIE